MASVDDTAAVVVDLRLPQIFLEPMTLSFALFTGGSGFAELVVVEVEDVDVGADVIPCCGCSSSTCAFFLILLHL